MPNTFMPAATNLGATNVVACQQNPGMNAAGIPFNDVVGWSSMGSTAPAFFGTAGLAMPQDQLLGTSMPSVPPHMAGAREAIANQSSPGGKTGQDALVGGVTLGELTQVLREMVR